MRSITLRLVPKLSRQFISLVVSLERRSFSTSHHTFWLSSRFDNWVYPLSKSFYRVEPYSPDYYITLKTLRKGELTAKVENVDFHVFNCLNFKLGLVIVIMCYLWASWKAYPAVCANHIVSCEAVKRFKGKKTSTSTLSFNPKNIITIILLKFKSSARRRYIFMYVVSVTVQKCIALYVLRTFYLYSTVHGLLER